MWWSVLSCAPLPGDHAEKAIREEQHHKKCCDRDDEGGKFTGRTQSFGHADQEDGAYRGPDYGAPASEDRGNDDLNAHGNVDQSRDGGCAVIEDEECTAQPGEKSADEKGDELVLGNVEAERGCLHPILPARLKDKPHRRTRER